MRQRKQSGDRSQYNFVSRYWVFIAIVLVMFGYLVSGIFRLQLLEGEDYIATAENRKTATITLRGSRGMITDSEAVILAHDEEVYNVTFYRDADQNSAREYADFTDSIVRAIDIIEEGGNELAVDFVIQRNEDTGNWEFNFGSGVSEAVLQTRESQWRSNHYMSVTGYPYASDCIERLKSRFRIAENEEEAQLRLEEYKAKNDLCYP